jgi:hypothetical protein
MLTVAFQDVIGSATPILDEEDEQTLLAIDEGMRDLDEDRTVLI